MFLDVTSKLYCYVVVSLVLLRVLVSCKRTDRVTPVSGNFASVLVATVNPFFQQLREDGVLVQVLSLSTSSAGAAKALDASANRPAPIDREKNIIARANR